eukprot:SAG11_NODE_40902_length_199_cov_34.300000_1_plen_26_part_01
MLSVPFALGVYACEKWRKVEDPTMRD